MKSRLRPVASDALLTSGGRELLKWLALVLMTGDHVNKVLLHGSHSWMTDIARVVFPIFALVFVCNLRLDDEGDHAWTAAVRTLGAAFVAQPFHAWAFGYWLPLNVLFTLSAGVFVVLLWRRSPVVSVLLFAFAGLWVDYSWPGLLVITSAVLAMRKRDPMFLPVGLAVAGLFAVNGNFYAVAALPLVAILGVWRGELPRWRWMFLAYYLGHLIALAFVAAYSTTVLGY